MAKACRRLEDAGQLSNAALAPLLKAAVTALAGRPAKALPAPVAPAPSALPLAQQPMRAVLAAWQADNGAHLAKAYLDRSKQYVDWMEKFDARVTPAAVDEQWAKRYSSFYGARHAFVQQHDSPAHQHAAQPRRARRPAHQVH